MTAQNIIKQNLEPLRQLTNFETFLFLLHDSVDSHVTPFCRVEIKGKIDEQKLKTALQHLQNMHPLLQACIIPNKRKINFYKLSSVNPIPLIVVKKDSESHWADLARIEVQKKFDYKNGELIRVFLLKDDIKQFHDVVIVAHHSIIDFICITQLYIDMFKLYDKLDQPIDDQLFEESTDHQYRQNVVEYYHNKKISIKARMTSFVTALIDGCQYLMGIRHFRIFAKNKYFIPYQFYSAKLDAVETKKINNICLEKGVTMFGLVSAIYTDVIKNEIQQSKFHSTFLINMRSYYCPQIGNQALGCYVEAFQKLPCYTINSEDIWSSAKQLNNYSLNIINLVFKTAGMPGSRLLLQLYVFLLKSKARLDFIFNQNQIGMSIINYGGNLKIDNATDFEIKSFNWSGNDALCKYNRNKNFVLSFVELNNEMQITLSSNLSPDQSNVILNKIINRIKDL